LFKSWINFSESSQTYLTPCSLW